MVEAAIQIGTTWVPLRLWPLSRCGNLRRLRNFGLRFRIPRSQLAVPEEPAHPCPGPERWKTGKSEETYSIGLSKSGPGQSRRKNHCGRSFFCQRFV